MKKLLKLTLTLLILNTLYLIPLNAQVGINNDNSDPDASAMLDVKSSDKGMLVPRMDSLSRNNIIDPATSLLVYDTDTDSFWYYDGMDWVNIGNVNSTIDLTNGITVLDSCEQIVMLKSANEEVLAIKDANLVSIENQSFTNNADSYSLYSVEVYFDGELGPILRESNMIDGIQNGTLRILEGDANGTVLYSQAISIPDVEVWNEILIEQPITISEGQQYTIQLEETNGQFTWVQSDNTPVGNNDFAYRVYGFICPSPYFVEPQTANATVSLSNIDTIRFSNGIEFDGTSVKVLKDRDEDTKIEVERNRDDDVIRFSQREIGEFMTINNGHLNYSLGINNIYLGTNAGLGDQFGQTIWNNIGIGNRALRENISNSDNIAIGSNALNELEGQNNDGNIVIGTNGLNTLESGANNVSIGNHSGLLANNKLTHINNSVLLGAKIRRGASLTDTFTNVVAIGHGIIV